MYFLAATTLLGEKTAPSEYFSLVEYSIHLPSGETGALLTRVMSSGTAGVRGVEGESCTRQLLSASLTVVRTPVITDFSSNVHR